MATPASESTLPHQHRKEPTADQTNDGGASTPSIVVRIRFNGGSLALNAVRQQFKAPAPAAKVAKLPTKPLPPQAGRSLKHILEKEHSLK